MNIDVNTGLISWTPTSIGDYDVVVQVNDNRNGIAQQQFVITVSEIIPPVEEPPKVFEIANYTGLTLLLTIFLYATYSDIVRIVLNKVG